MKYCTDCGTAINEGDTSCMNCGAVIEQPNNTNVSADRTETTASAASSSASTGTDQFKERLQGFGSELAAFLKQLKSSPYQALNTVNAADWKSALVILLLFSISIPIVLFRVIQNLAGGLGGLMGGGPTLDFSSFVFPQFFGLVVVLALMVGMMTGSAKLMQVDHGTLLTSFSRFGLLLVPAAGFSVLALILSLMSAFGVANIFVLLAFVLKITAFLAVIFSYGRSKPEGKGIDPFYAAGGSMILYVVVIYFAGSTLIEHFIQNLMMF